MAEEAGKRASVRVEPRAPERPGATAPSASAGSARPVPWPVLKSAEGPYVHARHEVLLRGDLEEAAEELDLVFLG